MWRERWSVCKRSLPGHWEAATLFHKVPRAKHSPRVPLSLTTNCVPDPSWFSFTFCKHLGTLGTANIEGELPRLEKLFAAMVKLKLSTPLPCPPATSSSFDLENLRWSHLSTFLRIYYREWDPPRVHLPPPSLKTLWVFFLWTCHSQLALRHLPCLTPPLLAHTHSHNLHPRDDSNIQRRLVKQAAFLKIASAVIKAIFCYINGGAQCKRKIWNHLFTKQEHGAIRGTKNKALRFLPPSLSLGLSWSFVFAI